MKSDGYDSVAGVWDILNSETDYDLWAAHIDSLIRKFGKGTKSILDLGCGTGSMTLALAELGYDMTGADLSGDMLSIARERAENAGRSDILYLCQDMSSFELYGTVGSIVCCLDGINHLTSPEKVKKCFYLANNYLDPGGMFIFDVNSPEKFRTIYGCNDYIIEDENLTCCWQNDYNEKTGLCRFDISLFTMRNDGAWNRSDSSWSERCYSRKRIEKWLSDAGFDVICVTDSYSNTPASDDNMRWCFTARKKN